MPTMGITQQRHKLFGIIVPRASTHVSWELSTLTGGFVGSLASEPEMRVEVR
jgi:predicted branched-subunit amino acid permease